MKYSSFRFYFFYIFFLVCTYSQEFDPLEILLDDSSFEMLWVRQKERDPPEMRTGGVGGVCGALLLLTVTLPAL